MDYEGNDDEGGMGPFRGRGRGRGGGGGGMRPLYRGAPFRGGYRGGARVSGGSMSEGEDSAPRGGRGRGGRGRGFRSRGRGGRGRGRGGRGGSNGDNPSPSESPEGAKENEEKGAGDGPTKKIEVKIAPVILEKAALLYMTVVNM